MQADNWINLRMMQCCEVSLIGTMFIVTEELYVEETSLNLNSHKCKDDNARAQWWYKIILFKYIEITVSIL